MNAQLLNVLLWAATFVAVAIVIAAGMRIVGWLVNGGDTANIWRAAAALIVGATGGGWAVSAIRAQSGND